MTEFKNIYEALPQNWGELKLKQFMKLTELEITEQDEHGNLFVGSDNTSKVISVLGNVSVDELEALPIPQFKKLAKKVAFIFITPPNTEKKTSIKWKKVSDLTYGDFVVYQQFHKNPLPHLQLIVKGFAKDELTEEQILELDMETVLTGFFLVLKSVKQYVKSTKRFLKAKLVLQIAKEKLRLGKQNKEK